MSSLEIFKGVTLAGPNSKAVDLWVDAGVVTRIVSMSEGESNTVHPPAAKVHDMKDIKVLPSGVDVQVHLRTPGQSAKETPKTGLLAAQAGGYGAVLSMPNTKPVIDNPETLVAAYAECQEAETYTGVVAKFTSSITCNLAGNVPVDFEAMAKAGAIAFTDDGKGVEKDDLMLAALRASADFNLPVLQHAEWPGHPGVLARSKVQGDLGLPIYEPKQEWSFVKRDLALLAQVRGARYHVLHVTTRETVHLIEAAKAQGLGVTAEASPHHLFFCADDIDPGNTAFKMNPPLHQENDRAAIRQAINDGVLDFVATDHAPHEAQAKGTDFKTAAYGTVGLESSLRVLLTGVAGGWLNADRLNDIFSRNPARFLGLDEYGEISVGKPLRAVFFRDCSPQPFLERDIKSLSKNSCFLNVELQGKIVGHYTRCGYVDLQNPNL